MLTKGNSVVNIGPSGKKPGGGKVRCPFCHRDALSITNSRLLTDSPLWVVRRRRVCEHCHKAFITFEMLESVYAKLDQARTTLTDFQKLISNKPTTEE